MSIQGCYTKTCLCVTYQISIFSWLPGTSLLVISAVVYPPVSLSGLVSDQSEIHHHPSQDVRWPAGITILWLVFIVEYHTTLHINHQTHYQWSQNLSWINFLFFLIVYCIFLTGCALYLKKKKKSVWRTGDIVDYKYGFTWTRLAVSWISGMSWARPSSSCWSVGSSSCLLLATYVCFLLFPFFGRLLTRTWY
jgi:hypothetical protein